jgi:hypothetical protein
MKKLIFLLPPPFKDGNRGLNPRGELPHQVVQLATCVILKNNFNVEILDAFLQSYSFHKILEFLNEKKPQVVGIPLTITNRELPATHILNLHDNIKKYFPNITIILFNWFYLEKFAVDIKNGSIKTAVEYFLFGDVEGSLPLLLDIIEKKYLLNTVPGLIYRNHSKYLQTTKTYILKI